MNVAGIKKNAFLFQFTWFFRRLVGITPEKLNLHFHQKRAKKLIAQYLKEQPSRKLQIGAQSNSIQGWLNVDIAPKNLETVYMDATQPFPFQDGAFDYVFSEHMIEHITFNEGQWMLKECYRVLKPGGKIRIATPNLQFLIELYQEHKTEIQQKYIAFSKKYFSEPIPEMDVLVINNFFRDWGHQFIHDEKSLRYLLELAGFSEILRKSINESDDENLRNLEQHGKEITEEFNHLETIVMEAAKK